MRFNYILISIFLIGATSTVAQQQTATPPHRKSSVQEIVRIVPELLPQVIRDSISLHPSTKNAEVTSAEQMSQNGNLIYKVNFLKDEMTWSKTYDVNGRHIDKIKEEDELQ